MKKKKQIKKKYKNNMNRLLEFKSVYCNTFLCFGFVKPDSAFWGMFY